MAKLFTNRGDLDQMTHSMVSELDLHYLPITIVGGLQTKMGLTLFLLNTTCPVLANSVDPDQLA